jgi:hypothetical protein
MNFDHLQKQGKSKELMTKEKLQKLTEEREAIPSSNNSVLPGGKNLCCALKDLHVLGLPYKKGEIFALPRAQAIWLTEMERVKPEIKRKAEYERKLSKNPFKV